MLILREVLRWQAAEVAELLDTTRRVGQQRAAAGPGHPRRAATLDAERPSRELDDGDERELLARYVDAFERYDIDRARGAAARGRHHLHAAVRLWLRGHDDMRGWYLGHGIGCKGSRLLPLEANGSPAFAQYKPATRRVGSCRGRSRCSRLRDGRIAHIHHFLDTRLFARFGQPAELAAQALEGGVQAGVAEQTGQRGRHPLHGDVRAQAPCLQHDPQDDVDEGQVGAAAGDVEHDERPVHRSSRRRGHAVARQTARPRATHRR